MTISGYVFGPDKPLVLTLLDITPMMGVLEGVVMELHDCAMPLLRDVIATDDPTVAFKVLRPWTLAPLESGEFRPSPFCATALSLRKMHIFHPSNSFFLTPVGTCLAFYE